LLKLYVGTSFLAHETLPYDNLWPLQDSQRIPRITKLCYAAGSVPYQCTTAALFVSQQIFLLDVVQMEAIYVSMILFLTRVWDGVTDPLVGYLVSRSKWTRIGKLKPWIAFSTPLGIIFYVMMWIMPFGSGSHAANLMWFLSVSCLFETLMTCYNIPYLTLNMFLGGNQKNRDFATAYRKVTDAFAMAVASAIQGYVVKEYNKEKQTTCQQHDHDDTTPQSTSLPTTTLLQKTQTTFLISALAMGGIFFLSSLILLFGVKEQRALPCSHEKVRPPFVTSLRMLACHFPYQRLVLGFVFCTFAFQTSLGNFALFCSHVAGLGNHFQLLILTLLSSSTVGVLIWQAVLRRVGKKTTLFIGMSLFLPSSAVIMLVPTNLPILTVMCVLIGISLATLFLLPWSMLPDVVDDFTLKHPSYQDMESLFFSCYAFCQKLGGSLAVGISTLTLQFVGYKANACHHGDGVTTALMVLFSLVPVVLLLMGILTFMFYPIDEREEMAAIPNAALFVTQEDTEHRADVTLTQVSAESSSTCGSGRVRLFMPQYDDWTPRQSSANFPQNAAGTVPFTSKMKSKVTLV
ncbi:sodium-dependent lysophosphatidylcholine symporter 1, partial [Thalassophryne amazonica]|uniref:sodium-dependent lysophosphatidylcholine symporter 1 n=1 Tax=Thalassophryne amazonica TaxID=390379 RepID=UPI0014718B0F